MSDPGPAGLSTEALLEAARRAADRLIYVSRDPDVRREAVNAAQAITRLLNALRNSGPPPA
ncbi:hypothetical protein E5F05_10415 [Deinococcus metallilatus]|uniref:Uncharacterized protein n=1 Tax=Deinococcus metallilatus TaxID=1211322 RepID=A0AAJ5JY46_9DEIO|nr:hypothetical protein [Deinococcus metallilatus]MBB5295844.1 hypothetical protein [Deinococcus metallilatus]QBY08314.1 hypothetical protein E5F05_10415 [Deinococcus metallilatus]RXJ12045.1 hypothetical protein ERJ73_09225 [Deinococcus metallilatus]TLK25723.1 hypothetical protein FCS05_11755 [Deinococcus metallilatus]GMA14625.1 hypothetical protein GCM10025871_09560 [Deinococcus metallilatus]